MASRYESSSLAPHVVRHSLLCTALLSVCCVGATAHSKPSPARRSVDRAIERIQDAKPPSVSTGTLRDGRLQHPAELPKPGGIGYFVSHPDRDTNFGADRMVFGLMRLGVTMQERLGSEPHHRILINEISDADGGKQRRHINHQMGLDVDLGFYAINRRDEPTRARWLKFDEEGLSPNKMLRYDTARNWVLVESILENETFGEIRRILHAEWLTALLLEHAESLAESAEPEESERLRGVIKRAKGLLRQPKSSPHDTHFHLSLKRG